MLSTVDGFSFTLWLTCEALDDSFFRQRLILGKSILLFFSGQYLRRLLKVEEVPKLNYTYVFR